MKYKCRLLLSCQSCKMHAHGEITRTQEVPLKKIIVECYRAVGSLTNSLQSSNFLLLLLLFFIDFGQG